MAAITDQEKRTIRFGAVVLAIGLSVVFGWRGWRALENARARYESLVVEAQRLHRDVAPLEKRALLAQKLKQNFHFDPAQLTKAPLAAQASAAIQNAARTGGVRLGPMRESPARSSGRELTSIQLEGSGPVPAILTLLHRLETIGYPLIVDSLQFTPDAKPGQLKVNMTIVILDYEQWPKEEPPRA